MSDLNNRLEVIEQMIRIQETVQDRFNDTINWFRYQIKDILTTQFQVMKEDIDHVQKKPKLSDTAVTPTTISKADIAYSSHTDSSSEVLVVDTIEHTTKTNSKSNQHLPAKSIAKKHSKTLTNPSTLSESHTNLNLEDTVRPAKTLLKLSGKIHKTTPQISKSIAKLTPPVKTDPLTLKNEEIKSRAVRLYNANVIPRIIGRLFDIKGYWVIHVWGNFQQFPPHSANKMRLEQERCLELYEKGFSSEEISKSLCLRSVRVKYYLGQLPNLSKFYCLEYRISACKEVIQGADIKNVCSKYKIPIANIQLWIKEYESTNTIKMSPYDSIKADAEYDGVVIRNVLEEYLVDQNINKVALKFKVSPQARILNWIQSFNDSLYIKETGSDEETESPNKPSNTQSQAVDIQQDVNQEIPESDVLEIAPSSELLNPAIVRSEVLIPEFVAASNTPSKVEMTKKFLFNLKETYSRLNERKEDN